jgi:hypothetical protein
MNGFLLAIRESRGVRAKVRFPSETLLCFERESTVLKSTISQS